MAGYNLRPMASESQDKVAGNASTRILSGIVASRSFDACGNDLTHVFAASASSTMAEHSSRDSNGPPETSTLSTSKGEALAAPEPSCCHFGRLPWRSLCGTTLRKLPNGAALHSRPCSKAFSAIPASKVRVNNVTLSSRSAFSPLPKDCTQAPTVGSSPTAAALFPADLDLCPEVGATIGGAQHGSCLHSRVAANRPAQTKKEPDEPECCRLP
mmetsp:Transcript_129745/g.416251  ORF Transcript_129745/g.416251 Transcript_129745/m.416251 type:complete len:213 (-) Transcript_129745:81-719(-)